MTTQFSGFSEELYRFFWEIAFDNSKSFFEANRTRYKEHVQEPLLALTSALLPTVAKIDPRIDTRPTKIVSRIRRDTRFTKDKSPYRDHAWLCFRLVDVPIGSCFCLYAEFERDAYGYGMGMYSANPPMMNELRARILARPNQFLALAEHPSLTELFTLTGEAYKRPKCPDAPDALQLWLNKKALSYCFSSKAVANTMSPGIVDEIAHGFQVLGPLYRFLMGLA